MDSLPQLFRLRQNFARPQVGDVAAEVRKQLEHLRLSNRIQPGSTVAITAGSRGIANIVLILRTAVDYLRSVGALPFIVPAMGSHGGGTAEGQVKVLASYGVTEASCNCPIRASMETIIVAQAAGGFPVYFDRLASVADHVLVINRVKPHTDFSGEFESGLVKMLLIGLGKHDGAKIYHRAVHDASFDEIVRDVGPIVLNKCNIVGGLGIVENAYDETAQITAVLPQDFMRRDAELQALAKSWLARLPFKHVDLLIIDEIGKNISGTGLDTNVVGRKTNAHKAEPDEWPKVRRIYVRDLTPETYGNAAGVGLAEFCHRRVVEKMDVNATRINCLTSGRMFLGNAPFDYPNDASAIATALPTIGLTEPPHAKLLWIKNTLHLEEVECSAAYWDEAHRRSDLTVLTSLRPMCFDAEQNLVAPSAEGTATA